MPFQQRFFSTPLLRNASLGAGQPPGPVVEIGGSRQFNAWLAEQQISLAFTTYQAGKLFLIGTRPDGRLSIFERTFSRCMGLHATPQTLYMTSLYQLWRLENALAPGELHQGHDRLYVPQIGRTTGNIDVHDVAIDRDGRIVFVNTLFGCLATVSETHSFVPLWKPLLLAKLDALLPPGAVQETDQLRRWPDRQRP